MISFHAVIWQHWYLTLDKVPTQRTFRVINRSSVTMSGQKIFCSFSSWENKRPSGADPPLFPVHLCKVFYNMAALILRTDTETSRSSWKSLTVMLSCFSSSFLRHACSGRRVFQSCSGFSRLSIYYSFSESTSLLATS